MVVGFPATLLLSPIPSIPKPLLPIHSLNSKTLPSVEFTTIPILRNPRNHPRRRRFVVVLADNNGGPNKESKQQRANSNGNNGGGGDGQDDFKRGQRAFFNFKWRNLLDPDPENIVAIGLTGLLTWASVQVLYQLFFISIAILVAALKYSFIAALLLFILITLL